MKFLSKVSKTEGVAPHVYVVGGAVRNFLMGVPVKDVDIVIDSVALGGYDSERFAKAVAEAIPAPTSLVTNQYGVAILTIKGDWILDGINLRGEVIEIANARKESYEGSGGKGKGYKPTDVQPATIHEDIYRREFTVNTLLWRLLDLTSGPEHAEIVDLTGLGKQHLEERILQTPLDPDRTFKDDPTRILRLGKFLLKYGLKPSPDVLAAARRQAPQLQHMPWEAVATIVVRDILHTAGARKGLRFLEELGVLPVLVELVQKTPPFAAFLSRQFTNGDHSVELLLDLADLGLETKALGFLSKSQQELLRSLVTGLSHSESRKFFDVLKTPPTDNLALIEEFGLVGKERGVLVPWAREILLEHPEWADRPALLNDSLRERLRRLPGKTASNPQCPECGTYLSYDDGWGIYHCPVCEYRTSPGRRADLNPPLGGGPCQIVDRIQRTIRSPGLREDLVEEVESGHSLPNNHALKVYPLDLEKGSIFGKFSISSHAQYRMDLREVTVPDVVRGLNSFAQQLKAWKSIGDPRYERTLSQDPIEWVDPKTRLKLVFGLRDGEIGIITAFWKGKQDPPPTECSPERVASRILTQLTGPQGEK
jgi:tRNA nucleotidyltransferase/poly(A) polymerase